VSRQKQPRLQRIRNAILVVASLPVVLLVLPLALLVFSLYLLYRGALYLLVWALWFPKGKDVLLVYSDSPIWREYMTTQVLPLVQKRAVVLNWSAQKIWPKRTLRPAVFHHFGGPREFNPLLVVFRPLRRAKVFRFWGPFKDWKRGYSEPVERLLRDVATALGQ
jgi:hypothetical protein